MLKINESCELLLFAFFRHDLEGKKTMVSVIKKRKFCERKNKKRQLRLCENQLTCVNKIMSYPLISNMIRMSKSNYNHEEGFLFILGFYFQKEETVRLSENNLILVEKS